MGFKLRGALRCGACGKPRGLGTHVCSPGASADVADHAAEPGRPGNAGRATSRAACGTPAASGATSRRESGRPPPSERRRKEEAAAAARAARRKQAAAERRARDRARKQAAKGKPRTTRPRGDVARAGHLRQPRVPEIPVPGLLARHGQLPDSARRRVDMHVIEMGSRWPPSSCWPSSAGPCSSTAPLPEVPVVRRPPPPWPPLLALQGHQDDPASGLEDGPQDEAVGPASLGGTRMRRSRGDDELQRSRPDRGLPVMRLWECAEQFALTAPFAPQVSVTVVYVQAGARLTVGGVSVDPRFVQAISLRSRLRPSRRRGRRWRSRASRCPCRCR